MNKNAQLREDNVFKSKIILLTIYCIFTVVIILVTNGSAEVLIQQLLLQAGNVLIDASPSQVKP